MNAIFVGSAARETRSGYIVLRYTVIDPSLGFRRVKEITRLLKYQKAVSPCQLCNLWRITANQLHSLI